MIIFTDEDKNTYQCTLRKNNLKAIRRKLVSKYGTYLGWSYVYECYFKDKEDYLQYLRDASKYASLARMNHDIMGDTEYITIGYPTLAIYITDLLKENKLSQEALNEIFKIASQKDKLERYQTFIDDIVYLNEILKNIDIKAIDKKDCETCDCLDLSSEKQESTIMSLSRGFGMSFEEFVNLSTLYENQDSMIEDKALLKFTSSSKTKKIGTIGNLK